jgi:hypothetical protein
MEYMEKSVMTLHNVRFVISQYGYRSNWVTYIIQRSVIYHENLTVYNMTTLHQVGFIRNQYA